MTEQGDSWEQEKDAAEDSAFERRRPPAKPKPKDWTQRPAIVLPLCILVLGTMVLGLLQFTGIGDQPWAVVDKTELGRQGCVAAYLTPSRFEPGDTVRLIVVIRPDRARASRVKLVTLAPDSGEALLKTDDLCPAADPWGGTVYGQPDPESIEKFTIQIPDSYDAAEGLPCRLDVNYVYAAGTQASGYGVSYGEESLRVVLRPKAE